MRILDKNTDFYDYWQNIYRDDSVTFDRTDSFLLTKEIFCNHIMWSAPHSKFLKYQEQYHFALLQVCNTFWLFLIEVTKIDEYDRPTEYSVELITTWKNYNKSRCLMKLDIVGFGWEIIRIIRHDRYGREIDKTKLFQRKETLSSAIDQNDFGIKESINRHVIRKGDGTESEKHIPLLKACGLAGCIDPLEIFLAFEEYFSLEKTSSERTTSIGLTDEEKIGNHGFDVKTSFRGS